MSLVRNCFLVILPSVLSIFVLISMHVTQEHGKRDGRLRVVCTTAIIADVVAHIGLPYVSVKALMGPGVDPHLYRARESDIMTMSAADIIFYNGLHLEGKMGEVFAHMNHQVTTIALAEAVAIEKRIATKFEHIYDPHIWHDVSVWYDIIPVIVDALKEKDPEHALYYQQQAHEYISTLMDLDAHIRKEVQKISPHRRVMVTAHDAFAYFGRAYGITVIGLQGMSTEALVSMHDIQKAVEYVVDNKIPAIFLESSIPPQSIEAVQRAAAARGWPVMVASELFSDSLGDLSTTAHSYCDMMLYNVGVITAALMVDTPVS